MNDQASSRSLFASVGVTAEPLSHGSDAGGLILRSARALPEHARHVGVWLRSWAETSPDRVFLAERDGSGAWREVTYADAFAAARSIGQALLDRGLSPSLPVVTLSENGVDLALLTLGAMLAAVPVAPVSPAYSLLSRDFAKLRAIVAMVEPGLIYASDGQRYERALSLLAAASKGSSLFVVSASPCAEAPGPLLLDLIDTKPGPAVDNQFDRIGPDTAAKILFTSGSTGEPKGVINTQRMLCSSQEALRDAWPFLGESPPILCDWLPWSHTFGGNHNFNLVLRNGGTLYIDAGKPAPGLIEITAKNVADASPTVYFNVPRGYDALVTLMERDKALSERFFRRLCLLHYAAAALPKSLWDRITSLSIEARGAPLPMVSAWGSTETSPLATAVHSSILGPGNIGVPVAGVEVKMAPSGGKMELRVRGPNVTPGYWKRPDLTAAAFDEDGFFRMGDAGKLADPSDPSKGLVFDGRIAEDFKLTSGTWVHVGALRVALITAGAPLIQDAVITGHDRDAVGALLFPNIAACRALCPEADADLPAPELLRRPAIVSRLLSAITAFNLANPGSSTRVARALLLAEPPSIDAGEITDKGYINQSAVLRRRAELVNTLNQGDHPDVIVAC